METRQVLKNRRSVRVFKPDAVASNLIEEILDCARLAPTARNEQPWEFVVLTKKDKIQELAGLTDHGRFIKDAPCVIAVFCVDTKYYLEDGSAATQNILLAAMDLGLGSCWVAGEKKDYAQAVNAMLGAPTNYKLVSLIPIGYPVSGAPKAANKRSLKEMLHPEVW